MLLTICLNNRVFLSRNCRLIVAPQKFDVLKRPINANFKNIKIRRGNYQTDREITKIIIRKIVVLWIPGVIAIKEQEDAKLQWEERKSSYFVVLKSRFFFWRIWQSSWQVPQYDHDWHGNKFAQKQSYNIRKRG